MSGGVCICENPALSLYSYFAVFKLFQPLGSGYLASASNSLRSGLCKNITASLHDRLCLSSAIMDVCLSWMYKKLQKAAGLFERGEGLCSTQAGLRQTADRM